MSDDNYEFSVIIPTIGRTSLQNAIRSIKLNGNAEIIVVHQCELDELPKELSEDNALIFVQNREIGAANGRNLGVRVAKHDWILFLDDDDYFLPKAFKRIDSAIKSYPATKVFSFQAYCLYSRIVKLKYHPSKSNTFDVWEMFKLSWREITNGFFMPGIVTSRTLALKVPFPTSLRVKEDIAWLVELQTQGFAFRQVNQPICVVAKDTSRSYSNESIFSYAKFARYLWTRSKKASINYLFGAGLRVQILRVIIRIVKLGSIWKNG